MEKELGQKIRDIRKARGITLDVLTMRTGLSTGYLSKIERGLNSPPIATLSRIASSLGIKLSHFFEAYEEDPKISIVRPSERKSLTRQGQSYGYYYETLAHMRQNKLMEPFVIRLTANPSDKRMFVHSGEEMLFLLQGEIVMTFGDHQYEITETGTCIYIDASTPHRADCRGEAEALVLVVLSQDPSEPLTNGASAEINRTKSKIGGGAP